MKITKLNDDSSWLWEWDGIKLMVDPWFSPSQVDFHPLFSEQFHVTPQPSIQELERPDYIFISHPFTDHCNKETLLQCDPSIPVISSKKVLRKVRRWNHFEKLLTLEQAPIQISRVMPSVFPDPAHEAFLFSVNGFRLLYAPHGSRAKKLPKADVLITTTTKYKLPFWLGGTVNLGYQHALRMKESCEAKWLITTHDERKKGTGLVEWLARKEYAGNEPECIEVLEKQCFDITMEKE